MSLSDKIPTNLKEWVDSSIYTLYWNFYHYNPPNPRKVGIDEDSKHELFHRNKAFIRVVAGGNRSGKTCTVCAELGMACLGSTKYTDYWKKRVPIRARLVAPDFPNSVTKAIIPVFKRFLPPKCCEYKCNAQGHISTIDFSMSSGSVLEIMTYEQTVLKHASVKLDIVAFDEPPPKNIFDENIARLVDLQGICVMGLTPIKEDGGYPIGWIYDEIYEKSLKKPNKYFWINIDIEDNRTSRGGFLPDESVDRQIAQWSKDPATLQARKSGKFTHLLGLVWKELDHTIHICDEFDVSDSNKWTRFAALDPHPRNPIAYVAWAVNRQGQHVIYDEIYQDNMLVADYCKVIKEHEAKYGKPRIRFMDESADQTNELSGLNVLREFGRNGIHCRKASNRTKYPFGIPKIRELLHPLENNLTGEKIPALKIFKRCTETWYQFTHYVYDEYTSARAREKANPKEKPRKKDDHLVDCSLYIASANPRFLVPSHSINIDVQEEPYFSKTGY